MTAPLLYGTHGPRLMLRISSPRDQDRQLSKEPWFYVLRNDFEIILGARGTFLRNRIMLLKIDHSSIHWTRLFTFNFNFR